ncbi:MAG: hypothetical protein GZ091_05605 [Paludibacter sp.]|nr:hypothetical protein [Paludibacter sp.]
MKKLFTIFLLSVLFVSTTFAAKNCVFIVKTDATADQNIINYLIANGYTVTVSVANGTVPTGEYDLAVISETNGSNDAVWKAFRNAPLPLVALKTFCARSQSNALSWLTTNVTGTDFANTTDVSVTTAAATHPIMDGVTENPQFHYQTVIDAWNNPVALQWLNFPTLPAGATIITTVTIGTGTTYTLTGPLPQTIAFERNTTMNLGTLANRAVIAGFNNFANAQLTPNALKVIKQACDWVEAGGKSTAIRSVVSNNLLKKSGNELVNPTNLEVIVYNTLGARILNSKESSINLSGLTKGVYVAKTNAGVLKFAL